MKAYAALLILTLAACAGGHQKDQIGGDPAPASFVCAGGKHFAVNFGQEGETNSATLTFENDEKALLLQEPSDTGSRYGWPSDGTNYVLLTEGQSATVLLKDGSNGGLETPVYSDCRLQ